MGDALYDALLREMPGAACRVYAPVGGHRDLLAYLVRRLLENGANSSFVSVAADPRVPVAQILERPQAGSARRPAPGTRRFRCRRTSTSPSGAIRRASSSAIRAASTAARGGTRGRAARREATPLVDGIAIPGRTREVRSPIDGAVLGHRHRRRRSDRHGGDDRGRCRLCRLGRDGGRGARGGADARRRCSGEEPRAPDRAPAGGGRQDPRRCGLRGARGRRLLPLLRSARRAARSRRR